MTPRSATSRLWDEISWWGSQAYAADLPSRAPPPVFVPVPVPETWGGCYGGAFGGYDIARVRTSGSDTTTTTTTTTGTRATTTQQLVGVPINPGINVPPGTTRTTTQTQTTPSSYGRTDSGGDGGARLGCNYQTGRLVMGGQIEGGYLGINGTATNPLVANSFSRLSGGPYAAFTAKLGYALADKTLIYLRGGVGYAGLHYTSGTLGTSTSVSGGQIMPLVGAGLEYKLTQNLSLTGEYTYMRPGCRTTRYTTPPTTTTTTSRPSIDTGVIDTTNVTTVTSDTATSCVDKHMISIGLNYYFDVPAAPIVARY